MKGNLNEEDKFACIVHLGTALILHAMKEYGIDKTIEELRKTHKESLTFSMFSFGEKEQGWRKLLHELERVSKVASV